jgi:hypothetical protein
VLEDAVLADLGIVRDELVEKKAIEVGNIFSLGTRFSDALGLTFTEESGADQSVVMGCYGIGPARLMGTVVELLSNEKGMVWPKEVSPFQIHLIAIAGGNEDVAKEADRLYELLCAHALDCVGVGGLRFVQEQPVVYRLGNALCVRRVKERVWVRGEYFRDASYIGCCNRHPSSLSFQNDIRHSFFKRGEKEEIKCSYVLVGVSLKTKQAH